MHRHPLAAPLLALLALVAAACSPPPSGDAGTDAAATDADATAVTDVPRPDAEPDAGSLFRPCAADQDCGGERGARCLLTYAGGLCSRRCTSDGTCGGGRCVDELCLPSCTLGGRECPTTQLCDWYDASDRTRRACFPACWTMPPSGAPACVMGYQCNAYVGGGQCTRFPAPESLGENGAPCENDDACRGNCIEEVFDGRPTGWANGYCYSFGRVPALDLYGPDLPLPRGNCPAGSVILPFEDDADEGDAGECLKECRMDSDCRPGYGCIFYEFRGGRRSTTGYCASINCLFPRFAMMPNNACAPGFTCRANATDGGTPTSGLCVRSPAGDGGVPDGSAGDAGGSDGGSGADAAGDVGTGG